MSESGEAHVAFGDFVGVLRRRGWLLASVFAIVALAGIALAYRLPPVYESTGVLLAEQPEVPEYIVQSTVPNYPEERVRVITQRVLTTNNLRRIAESNELYPELGGSDDLVLRELRDNLSLSAENPDLLENILGSGPSANAIAFSISFRHPDAPKARDVARDLVDLYLLENQAARREQAASTAGFLTEEASRLEQEIGEREQRIADFKRENAGALPEITEANRELLERLSRDIDDAEREIRTLREQERLYGAELAELSPYAAIIDEQGDTLLGPQDQLEVLQRRYLQLSARYGDDHPDLVKLRREMEAIGNASGLPAFQTEALEAELALRESELESLRNRYSSDMPDVQQLQRVVADLRERLAGSTETAAAPSTRRRAPNNPVYLQRQVMLEGVRSELRVAIDRRESLRLRRTEIADQITVSPEVEREYRALNRGYEELLRQYSEVETKLRGANTAVNLENELMGERFVVLSQAGLPSRPASPNRIAFLMLTLAAAGGLGAAAVAFAERRDDTVRNGRDVTNYIDIPPLVAIPRIDTPGDKRRRLFMPLAGATVGVVWLAAVAFLVMTPAV